MSGIALPVRDGEAVNRGGTCEGDEVNLEVDKERRCREGVQGEAKRHRRFGTEEHSRVGRVKSYERDRRRTRRGAARTRE